MWFNKPGYIAGETIWFKAYVFSEYDVSYISTSLFVELYDSDKKIIGTKLLPLIYGVTEGSFDLDSKINEGVYYLRAYTRWMLNFNEVFQYIRPIPIYNPVSVRKLAPKNSWNAFAMPEGGTLIDGFETKVAVRRISTSSLDSKWKGWLYEESEPSRKLEEFSSLDENVALFTFTPEEGKKYMVYVKDEKDNFKICSLPQVKNAGVVLSVEDESDSISCKLRFWYIPGNGNDYSLLGEIQNQLVFQADLKKTSSITFIKIPKAGLGNGILHLTVFDPEKKPVIERLVFLNPDKLNVDSSSVIEQTISAGSRAKNDMHLVVDSLTWLTYAVSVSDADLPSPLENENLLSALWLSSDLTNPLQRPAQYFEQPDKLKTEALDAIMISEKWSRFKWDDILNNKFPEIIYPPLKYLSYIGVVKKGNKLKPNEDINLFLNFPDSSSQVIQVKTDNAGNIVVDDLAFTGDVKVFYQVNSKKNSAKLIDISFENNNRFVPYPLPFPESPYNLAVPGESEKSPAWVERAASSVKLEKKIEDKYKSLQEVIVRAKIKSAKQELNEKLSSALFKSMNEIVFDFVNEEKGAMGYNNILRWLGGRVAGLYIQYEGGFFVPYIRGSRARIYLDEMPVDANWAGSIPVNDIAMIKIFKGPYIPILPFSTILPFSNGGGGGIIAIYTKRGGDIEYHANSPSLPNQMIKGYDTVKKFFSPDYSNESAPHPDADNRDQLLWQTLLPPSVALDKSPIEFFNNDNTRRFRLTVQGFNEKGFPVYFEKIIVPPLKAF